MSGGDGMSHPRPDEGRASLPSGAEAHRRAAYWKQHLGLQVLEGESGWWAPASTSPLQVRVGAADLAASSAIHYLLDADRPVNVWHRLASEDTHVLIEGGPVEYVLLPDGGPARREVLGRDVAAGQRPIVSAPAGCWKALRLVDGAGYALIGTVVSPGWTPDRVRIRLPEAVRAERVGTEPWLDGALLDHLDHDHRRR